MDTEQAFADSLESKHSILDRMEVVYLAAIRIVILLIATALVVAVIWYAVSGGYKLSRDASAVKEQPAVVAADDIVQIDTNKQAAQADQGATADPLAAEKAFFKAFEKRYFALFNQRFVPFRQVTDDPIDQAAFGERFVQSVERLKLIADGTVSFEQQRADLEDMFIKMNEASTLEATVSKLDKYRKSKRVSVSRVVSGTKSQAYCSYYGYYIDQCISYSTRQIPYRTTVTELQLPKGVISYDVLFGAYQERFMTLLEERRLKNVQAANAEREARIADNAEGSVQLWTAVKIAAGFIALMFLFLLIAIERHQRKIAEGTR